MIEKLSTEDGVNLALTALLSDRLALLAGAGLSMDPPSSLPSAAALAATAKARYDATRLPPAPPLPDSIDDQAEHFFQNGELFTVYLRRLIDRDAFASRPNHGHNAVADLLLVQGIQTAVTTNVDSLIEAAGQFLYGQIGAGIDVAAMAALHADTSPLLKVHGCRQLDIASTIWARGQLDVAPFAARIAACTNWLEVRLRDRDLLVVGYWSDWDYLNRVLRDALGAVNPSRVIVVNPTDSDALADKAPHLYSLGERAKRFVHVQASGATFLALLRSRFSKTFIKQLISTGADEYEALTGGPPEPHWLTPPSEDNEALWQLRRDLEGCAPNRPAVRRTPPVNPSLGLTLLRIQAHGGQLEGTSWRLNGRRIRIVLAEGKPLHRVEREYERDLAPILAPDIVIAVGAAEHSLPKNFARPSTQATIARGAQPKWLTREKAETELGL